MQTYQNTKPTDIAWLGEVPEHWGVSKLGRILKPFSQKNHAHLPLLSITRELGVIERDVENQDENHNFIPDDLSGYKLLKKGQFGMNKMKAWQGSYGVSPYTGIVSPAYFIFDFTQEINPDFFHWAIRCKLYVSFFGSASDGVRVGQWDLSKSRMKEIPFVIPPLSEQTAIANFLDKKTAQIKEAIALKSEQIDKLKEYRQTLINQTVTQGLNPNALMKNSGVEWLGEVPSHWEVKKLKYFGFVYAGINGKSGDDFSKDIQENQNFKPFIPFTNICNNSIIDNLNYQYVKVSKYETQNKVLNGDVLFLMSSETLEDIAKSSLYLGQDDELYLNSFCKAFRVTKKENLNPKFLNYLLLSQACRNYFSTVARGFTRINLKQEYVNNLNTPIPPLSEQIAIANFLDDKTAQIDTAIRQYQAEIDKLKEYQQSLVNEVVTGKVRVKQD